MTIFALKVPSANMSDMQKGRFDTFEDLKFNDTNFTSTPRYKTQKRRRTESQAIIEASEILLQTDLVHETENVYNIPLSSSMALEDPGVGLTSNAHLHTDFLSKSYPSPSELKWNLDTDRSKKVLPDTDRSKKVLASEFFGATKNKYKSRITKFVRAAQTVPETAKTDSNASEEKDLKKHYSFKQDAVSTIGDVIDIYTDRVIAGAINIAKNRKRKERRTEQEGLHQEEPLTLRAEDVQNSVKSLGVFPQVIEALNQ